jgi:hypothetical protein
MTLGFIRNLAYRITCNAKNVAISDPGFRVNFLFVPGFGRYSDANPEQITIPSAQARHFGRLALMEPQRQPL